MNAALHAAEIELRAAGLRVTAPRALILGILRRSGQHLDASEIHAAARRHNPGLSLATVYRTMRALRRAGLVEQRYLGPGRAQDHFEAAGSPEHYHFTCSACGRVFEFETPLVARVQADLEARLGWLVRQAIVSLEGLCQACRERAEG